MDTSRPQGPPAGSPPPIPPISLAIVNARVRTGDPGRPWADGIAVRGERLAAVGGSAAVRKLAGADARVVDARGALIVGTGSWEADATAEGAVAGIVSSTAGQAGATPTSVLARGAPASFDVLAGATLPAREAGMPPVGGATLLMRVVDGRIVYERQGPEPA